LINNYDLSSKPRDDKYNDLDNETLYNLLLAKDKTLAEKIGINNKKRLVRALQVIDQGKDLQKKNKKIYEVLLIECKLDRKEVYERINLRTEIMFKQGWVKEVEEILKKYPNFLELNASKAIGYKEIANSITNKVAPNIEKIKTETRHYAKRQLTWINNHYENTLKYNGNNFEEIKKHISLFLNDK